MKIKLIINNVLHILIYFLSYFSVLWIGFLEKFNCGSSDGLWFEIYGILLTFVVIIPIAFDIISRKILKTSPVNAFLFSSVSYTVGYGYGVLSYIPYVVSGEAYSAELMQHLKVVPWVLILGYSIICLIKDIEKIRNS